MQSDEDDPTRRLTVVQHIPMESALRGQDESPHHHYVISYGDHPAGRWL